MLLGDSWILALLFLFLIAYKNLPFVWFYRFIRTLITRLFITPITIHQLRPEYLFLPAIHRTRSPCTECDYNLHKSNSTYFTDLDISRGNLSLLLFSTHLSFRPTPITAVMILSGVQCVFRREIKPYQPYEVWSRVMAWDEKWIYIVSHFVERGAFRPSEYCLQRGERQRIAAPEASNNDPDHEKSSKRVFASAVSRYVFKQGRRTFSPELMLIQCGLLPGRMEEDPEVWRSIEKRRRRDVEAAQLERGWDAVHEAFDANVSHVLGVYTDLLWR